jgi:hypothetical protein
MMGYETLLQTLADPAPPAELELPLKALWYDANDRPQSAWRAAEADDGHFGKRVRAYLCRKAGDERNARLWYWRSGASPWTGSPQSEWEDIVRTVLAERVVASAYS